MHFGELSLSADGPLFFSLEQWYLRVLLKHPKTAPDPPFNRRSFLRVLDVGCQRIITCTSLSLPNYLPLLMQQAFVDAEKKIELEKGV